MWSFKKGWAKWGRLPSYLYARYMFNKTTNYVGPWCPCIDGSNDFYWNGWWKQGKDCSCGG